MESLVSETTVILVTSDLSSLRKEASTLFSNELDASFVTRPATVTP